MTITLNGTTGITSPGGDTSTSLSTGSLVVSGTSNTSALTVGNVALGAGNATRFKNRIINGDMRIDQRFAGGSIASSGNVYSLDRWKMVYSLDNKFTVQQQSSVVPTGFTYAAKITSSSAYTVGSTELFVFQQPIEGNNIADLGWGTANAKTVTLSFQVYSSLTGTFGGSLQNSAGNRSYPFSYSIPVANTWTSISITITGDITGTWLTTNGVGIAVNFGLGVGSTYSGTAGSWAAANYKSATGATSVVGTNGATFYITGVQLEVGSSATGFEYVDYTTQLAMCQRYYVRYTRSTAGFAGPSGGIVQSATTADFGYPLVLRATPSVGYSGLYLNDAGVNNAVSSIAVASTTTTITSLVNFTVTAATGFTVGRAAILYVTANGYIDFSAEL